MMHPTIPQQLFCRYRIGNDSIVRRLVGITSTSTRSLSASPFYGAPRSLTEPPSSTLMQRLLRTTQSIRTAVADPTRADAVAALGELTGHSAVSIMHRTMMADPTGQRILRDRPIVKTMPFQLNGDDDNDVTFGQAYGRFLTNHAFDAEKRDPVKYIDDPDLAYVMLRYRQCHDFWHVLTGLPPTVLGELGLKWLELMQTGLPVAAMSVTFGTVTLNRKERHILHWHYMPWAVQMSRQAKYLMNVYYEEEFDTNLIELRKKLHIQTAPYVDLETRIPQS